MSIATNLRRRPAHAVRCAFCHHQSPQTPVGVTPPGWERRLDRVTCTPLYRCPDCGVTPQFDSWSVRVDIDLARTH